MIFDIWILDIYLLAIAAITAAVIATPTVIINVSMTGILINTKF